MFLLPIGTTNEKVKREDKLFVVSLTKTLSIQSQKLFTDYYTNLDVFVKSTNEKPWNILHKSHDKEQQPPADQCQEQKRKVSKATQSKK